MISRHTARGQIQRRKAKRSRNGSPRPTTTPSVPYEIHITIQGEKTILNREITSEKRAIRVARREGKREAGRRDISMGQNVTIEVFAGDKRVFDESIQPRK